MSEAKFTPGPWNTDSNSEGEIYSRRGIVVAFVTNREGDNVGLANAHLIAAAPELYEQLKIARECIAYCRRVHPDLQSGEGIPVELFIDAALRKARGETPKGDRYDVATNAR